MSKVALIGAGRWGKNILRNLYNLGALELVCDADDKNLEFVADNYPEVTLTKSVDEVIGNSNIKGVFLATPAATHFELARKLLEVGKDIFVEKPIVLEMAHLEELQKIAAEKDLIVMEGHLLLYHPAVLRLRQAVADGNIGTVNHAYFKRTALGNIRFESSVLWDLGPHDLSILLQLIPEMPKNISASGIKVFEQGGGEEVVVTTLKYQDKLVYLHESWLDPFKDRKIIVVGDKGMLVMDELAEDGKIKLYDKCIAINDDAKFEHEIFKYNDGDFTVLDYSDSEPLRDECAHFIECITERKTPVSNIENSKKVLSMLLAATESLNSK